MYRKQTKEDRRKSYVLTSFLLRTAFRRSDDKRDAQLTTPEGIECFDDLRYGEDAKWNMLDVYRPKGTEGALPVIVSVHGGGWVYGDKERYQYYCMSLAGHGFAVVNFTYRLAPKHKFPAALEDTNAVFHWLMRHGADYGLNTSRVFGVGDSAGAQLLGLFGCLCTNPAYASGFAFSAPADFAPTAVALNCGVWRGTARTASSLKWPPRWSVSAAKQKTRLPPASPAKSRCIGNGVFASSITPPLLSGKALGAAMSKDWQRRGHISPFFFTSRRIREFFGV